MLASTEGLALRTVSVDDQHAARGSECHNQVQLRLLLHGSDCQFFPGRMSCTLSSPNSKLSVTLTLILEDKGTFGDLVPFMEKAMAPHSSTLVWKIPWTEEPGGPQSMGSLRVRRDSATSLSLSCIGEGNGNPLQCSCLENPRDSGAWWAAIYGVTQSRT